MPAKQKQKRTPSTSCPSPNQGQVKNSSSSIAFPTSDMISELLEKIDSYLLAEIDRTQTDKIAATVAKILIPCLATMLEQKSSEKCAECQSTNAGARAALYASLVSSIQKLEHSSLPLCESVCC